MLEEEKKDPCKFRNRYTGECMICEDKEHLMLNDTCVKSCPETHLAKEGKCVPNCPESSYFADGVC